MSTKTISNSDQTVDDFNNLLLMLLKNIASVCPDSIIGRNIKDIDKTFKSALPVNKSKFMDIFIAKVLQYKPQIDSGNEDFFLKKKSYDDDLKDISDGQESWADTVFEFKTVWTQLKRENKDLVIQYMKILCELAQNYFLSNC